MIVPLAIGVVHPRSPRGTKLAGNESDEHRWRRAHGADGTLRAPLARASRAASRVRRPGAPQTNRGAQIPARAGVGAAELGIRFFERSSRDAECRAARSKTRWDCATSAVALPRASGRTRCGAPRWCGCRSVGIDRSAPCPRGAQPDCAASAERAAACRKRPVLAANAAENMPSPRLPWSTAGVRAGECGFFRLPSIAVDESGCSLRGRLR